MRTVARLCRGSWAIAIALWVAACGGRADEGAGQSARAPTYQGKPPIKAPPANVVGGFEARLPKYTLKPGAEEFPCWIVPIDIKGPSTIGGGAKLTVGAGMHHGNLTVRPKTGDGLRVCAPEDTKAGSEALDIAKGGGWVFASSTQVVGEEWQSFPPGHGYRINPSFEIVARMHYLNTTAKSLEVEPRYEWFTIDEATLVHRLAPFGFVLSGFKIPPLSSYTGTGYCKMQKPFFILSLLPHMHALGTAFTAEFAGGGGPHEGDRFLQSEGYDPDNGVMVQYQPAVDLGLADGVRFACTWKNTHNKTIVEGVGDNEMCMLFGYGYPHDKVQAGFASVDGPCVVVQVPTGK